MNRPSPDDMKAMQVMEYVEQLEKENKRFEELLTKGKDRRIKILIKENKELRQQNKEIMNSYIKSEKAADARYRELEKENKELKNELAECHGLMDEIDYWKREAKKLGWKNNLMEEDTIQELKDIGEF